MQLLILIEIIIIAYLEIIIISNFEINIIVNFEMNNPEDRSIESPSVGDKGFTTLNLSFETSLSTQGSRVREP